MYYIEIKRLSVQASVGVHPEEHRQLQAIVIDVSLGVDVNQAAADDDFSLTLDYAKIAEDLQKIAVARHYQLIESMHYTMMNYLRSLTKVQTVHLRISKPEALPGSAIVSISNQEETMNG